MCIQFLHGIPNRHFWCIRPVPCLANMAGITRCPCYRFSSWFSGLRDAPHNSAFTTSFHKRRRINGPFSFTCF